MADKFKALVHAMKDAAQREEYLSLATEFKWYWGKRLQTLPDVIITEGGLVGACFEFGVSGVRAAFDGTVTKNGEGVTVFDALRQYSDFVASVHEFEGRIDRLCIRCGRSFENHDPKGRNVKTE